MMVDFNNTRLISDTMGLLSEYRLLYGVNNYKGVDFSKEKFEASKNSLINVLDITVDKLMPAFNSLKNGIKGTNDEYKEFIEALYNRYYALITSYSIYGKSCLDDLLFDADAEFYANNKPVYYNYYHDDEPNYRNFLVSLCSNPRSAIEDIYIKSIGKGYILPTYIALEYKETLKDNVVIGIGSGENVKIKDINWDSKNGLLPYYIKLH